MLQEAKDRFYQTVSEKDLELELLKKDLAAGTIALREAERDAFFAKSTLNDIKSSNDRLTNEMILKEEVIYLICNFLILHYHIFI